MLAMEVWYDHKSKVPNDVEGCSRSLVVSVVGFVKLSLEISIDLILSIALWQFIGSLKWRFLNLKLIKQNKYYFT